MTSRQKHSLVSLASIWGSLEQARKPTPYVLIDCAGIDGGQSGILREAFSELECLFTGDLALELADVGPYLGRMKSYDPNVKAVLENMLESHVALLLTLEIPVAEHEEITFSQVHRHFRKFNVVYDPTGKPLFFRYYDPRVLVNVLAELDAEQLNDFFGPVDTMILADLNGVATSCALQGGKLLVSKSPHLVLIR